MIGLLKLSDSLQAVLEDTGVWSCPHRGFEDELNALHRPRAESPDFTLPYGVCAVTRAAQVLGVDYELAVPLERSPEVEVQTHPGGAELAAIRRELRHALDFEEIDQTQYDEAGRALEALASEGVRRGGNSFRDYLVRRKAIEQRGKDKLGREIWINTDTGKRAANPNRKKPAGGEPHGREQESPTSYNVGGNKPTDDGEGSMDRARVEDSVARRGVALKKGPAGMIKVPDLVDGMLEDNPGMTREQAAQELLRLQAEDKLTIGVVNDPHLEPRADEMIQSKRGKLGYVQLRPQVFKRGEELAERPAPEPEAPRVQDSPVQKAAEIDEGALRDKLAELGVELTPEILQAVRRSQKPRKAAPKPKEALPFKEETVKDAVVEYERIRGDRSLRVEDVRAGMEKLRGLPKGDLYEIARRIGYTPSGSRDAVFRYLLSNLENIKVSQHLADDIVHGNNAPWRRGGQE